MLSHARLVKTAGRIALASFACLVLLGSAAGCKNSPDKVCKRYTDMMAVKVGKKGLITKEDKERFEETCTKEMEDDKEKNPKRYECTAKCINDSKELDDVEVCMKKCPKDE
ncbi:MAG: hypothetical protein ABI175_06635 [Polyangiales bacterium]